MPVAYPQILSMAQDETTKPPQDILRYIEHYMPRPDAESLRVGIPHRTLDAFGSVGITLRYGSTCSLLHATFVVPCACCQMDQTSSRYNPVKAQPIAICLCCAKMTVSMARYLPMDIGEFDELRALSSGLYVDKTYLAVALATELLGHRRNGFWPGSSNFVLL